MLNDKSQRGTILKELRKSKGLNQGELANYLGISAQAYQKYEYGTAEATYDTLCALANFYGVTTDYLLGRDKGEPDMLDSLAGRFNMNGIEKKIAADYLNLPLKQRGDMIEFLHRAVMEAETGVPADTPAERELLDKYRLLNDEGQDKAAGYIDDLVTSGKYKKSQDTVGNIA